MIATLRRALYAAGAALLALTLAFHLGQRRARARQRAAQDAAYRNTRQRIDHAHVSRGDAADDAAWLRNRAARGGL
jgi:hypothetical protein